jgi:hypothetical protein
VVNDVREPLARNLGRFSDTTHGDAHPRAAVPPTAGGRQRLSFGASLRRVRNFIAAIAKLGKGHGKSGSPLAEASPTNAPRTTRRVAQPARTIASDEVTSAEAVEGHRTDEVDPNARSSPAQLSMHGALNGAGN